jgi:hypothetical protein
MGIFSNASQVTYAAAAWVFGGDGTLTSAEQQKIKNAVNRDKTPWSVDVDDIKFVISLWKGSDFTLSDITDAIDYEFNFSLEEKYILYSCVCVTMNNLDQGYNSEDGWGRANELLSALNIDSDAYNRWAD